MNYSSDIASNRTCRDHISQARAQTLFLHYGFAQTDHLGSVNESRSASIFGHPGLLDFANVDPGLFIWRCVPGFSGNTPILVNKGLLFPAQQYLRSHHCQMAMGQNPVPPVNIPIPTKIPTQMGGAPTNQNGTIGFDPQPDVQQPLWIAVKEACSLRIFT